MFRFLRRLILLAIASFLLASGLYSLTDSFSQRWRGFVTGELAKHGVFLDFERLMISPFGGLMAQEVQGVYPDAVGEAGGYLTVNYSKV